MRVLSPTKPVGVLPRSRSWRGFAWVQVVMAALAMVATLPGRTHGLGMITERLLKDLQMDPVSYGAINLWATLLGAAFCLPIGYLIERFGVRWMLTTVLASLGAVVLLMCRISLPLGAQLSTWLGGALSPEASVWLILFLAVLLTRGLGQSALSVVSLSMVGKWFERRLSVAMALFSVLVSIGFMIAAFVCGLFKEPTSWQTVWGGLGWIVLGFAPLAWLLVRDTPEACGMSADSRAKQASTALTGFTLRQALATPAFWVFGLGSSLYGLIATAVALFNQSILAKLGFGQDTFYSVMIGTAFVGMASNFLGGWIAARWSIGRLRSVGMLVLAAALCALPYLPAEPSLVLYTKTVVDTGFDSAGLMREAAVVFYPQLVPYVLAMGMAGGIVTVVFFTIWGYAFGRLHLGKIQGAGQALTVLASAIGPWLLALCLARYRSYNPMFFALAGVSALFCVLAWFVPILRPPTPVLAEATAPDLAAHSDKQPGLVSAIETSSSIKE